MYRDINEKIKEQGSKKDIVSFRQAYKKARKKKLIDIITNPEGMHYKVTYQQELTEWVYANRRQGAPKHTWNRVAMEQLWEEIRCKDNVWRNIPLDIKRRDIKDRINSYAREEKTMIEQERGVKKYPGGMNWGIDQKLEDNTLREREEREGWEARREREGEALEREINRPIYTDQSDYTTRDRDREGGERRRSETDVREARWISGGNLRSTTRGTDRGVHELERERGEENRERESDRTDPLPLSDTPP